uniref:Protein transport protein Sec61 beta subunit n=1 Tax=Arundo donax TaxID=35708 RepID=A0A0A9HBJ6_ARUDO
MAIRFRTDFAIIEVYNKFQPELLSLNPCKSCLITPSFSQLCLHMPVCVILVSLLLSISVAYPWRSPIRAQSLAQCERAMYLFQFEVRH